MTLKAYELFLRLFCDLISSVVVLWRLIGGAQELRGGEPPILIRLTAKTFKDEQGSAANHQGQRIKDEVNAGRTLIAYY